MKVGNIINGLEVIDVKRVNKMNIIQFTKAVSEYIDQGYKIDVNSSRAIGLVLQVDMYKLESATNVGDSTVGSVGNRLEETKDETTNNLEAPPTCQGVVEGVLEDGLTDTPNTSEANENLPNTLLHSDNKEVDNSDKVVSEVKAELEESVEGAKVALGTFTTPEQNGAPVKKTTQHKKTK